jgi:molybdate transport system ATP-binding protein
VLALAVRKRLPGFTLDVAWEAGDGVVALFGQSGSGKSLTLQCLAGLVRPDAGRIVLNGAVLFDADAGIDLPPQRRRLGYVFQGYALFPHLTVAENVAFGLAGRTPRTRRQRTVEILDRLGLAGLERRYPRELSGGQQQRVALGRALAVDPALLLLDEPLSALDAPLRRQLRDELVRVIRDFRTPTVLVTHDLAEAFQLADRIVVYEQGRVVQAAPKSGLLTRPASEQVARLFGVRNILHGTVVDASPAAIRLAWRGRALTAGNSPSHAYLPPPGTPVAFFVRPEYVRLVRKDRPAPEHQNRLEGRIVGEVDMGTSWVLYFAVEGAEDEPVRDGHDLEIEVATLVYEMLGLDRDRRWAVTIQPSAIQVLPGSGPGDAAGALGAKPGFAGLSE